MRKNLTLDPAAGLLYVKTRKLQIGNQWVDTLEIQETSNGLLSYNRQLGRLLDFTRPKVVKSDKGRVISVTMRLLLPSPLGPRWKILIMMKVILGDGLPTVTKNVAGTKQDANAETLNYANRLYRSWQDGIDPEFARAKCIRHSLKNLAPILMRVQF